MKNVKQFLIFIILGLVLSFIMAKFLFYGMAAILFVLVTLTIFFIPVWAPVIIILSIVGGQLLRYSFPSGGGIILTDILLPLVIFSWFIYKLTIKKKFIQTNLNLPMIFFIMIVLLSWLVNIPYFSSLGSILYLFRLIGYFLLYFVFVDLLQTSKFDFYLKTIVWVAVILSILGFIQLRYFPYFIEFTKYNWDPHFYRLLSTFFDPNYLAGFFSLVIAIITALFLYTKKISEKFYLFLVGLPILVALVLTYSRSGYLALLVTLLMIGFMRSWKLLLVMVIASLLLLNYIPRFQERILGALSVDITAKMRVENWTQTWQIIQDKPILGIGYNNLATYKLEKGLIAEESLVSHSAAGSDNSFLTIWVTTGILGLSTFVLILLVILHNTYRVYKNRKTPLRFQALSLAIFAATVGLVFHAQFVNSLLFPHILLLYLFMLGLFYKTLLTQKDRS